jgi:hypothetical protein
MNQFHEEVKNICMNLHGEWVCDGAEDNPESHDFVWQFAGQGYANGGGAFIVSFYPDYVSLTRQDDKSITSSELLKQIFTYDDEATKIYSYENLEYIRKKITQTLRKVREYFSH